jgi:hypothetical protein
LPREERYDLRVLKERMAEIREYLFSVDIWLSDSIVTELNKLAD